MNVHPPQFISESCLYLSCGKELNVPSKLICSPSSFPQYITLMETVSCSLLVSVSSYFYFSGAGLFSFSLYTALLILEQEGCFYFFFSLVTSVPIFLWFSTFNSPSFLSNLARSALRPRNSPLGHCVSAVAILHVCSSGKLKLFWDAA